MLTAEAGRGDAGSGGSGEEGFNSTLNLDSGYVSARYPYTLLYKGRGGGQEEAGIFHTAVKTINITGETNILTNPRSLKFKTVLPSTLRP